LLGLALSNQALSGYYDEDGGLYGGCAGAFIASFGGLASYLKQPLTIIEQLAG
jgi:hypothetical protein